MYILGIESSTKRLNIAVSRENRLLYQNSVIKDTVFMQRIIPLADRVLKKIKIDLSSIDVFTVDTGPGDFTGTRIGISVAKSFSMANKKPVFGIPGLDIFAAGLFGNSAYRIQSLLKKGFTVLLFPVMDVKHDEVYFSVYKVSISEKGNTVTQSAVGGVDYYIEKTIQDHLVELKDINDAFENLVKTEGLIDISSRSSHVIFTGGTAFDGPGNILAGMRKMKYNIFFSKKSLYPEARFLNQCTLYRILQQSGKSGKDHIFREYMENVKGDDKVAPIYVREFIPFGKEKGKSTGSKKHAQ